MKVLGILGSPRPNGNTATLLSHVMAGAISQGATTTTLSANRLNIRPCQGCEACRKTGKCVLRDDMQEVYHKIDESDAIILASPNYMGGIAGNLKPLIDRLNSYISASETGELGTTITIPKKIMLLLTQNAPEEYSHYIEAFTPLRGVLHLIFQGSFNALVELLVAPGIKGVNSVANNPQLIQKAYTIGENLAK
jgi:NAD(P)H-dependent FMN reductase